MIEKRLDAILTDMSFIRMNSNNSGIYLFYRIETNNNTGGDSLLRIISVIHMIDGNEFTREQYGHILEKMKQSINCSDSTNIQLLSLILTASPEKARLLCINQPEDDHWIIDLIHLRLMLYENHFGEYHLTDELQDFRSKIEQQLEEEFLLNLEQRESETGSHIPVDYASIPQPPQRKDRILTPVNTCILLLNVLAFILSYFIPVFGGTDKTLAKGALSWFYVLKEGQYYRILTSMFLHADLSHLFNNMLVLLFVGYHLEHAVGKVKYLIIYIGGGILAGFASIGYNMWEEYNRMTEGTTISIGASGAIFGVVGAMLLIVIVNRGRLEEISTRQMIVFVVLSLYSGIANTRIDQAAHVGGFVAGFVLAALIYRRPVKNLSGGEVTT